MGILLEDGAMATFKRVLEKETKTAADARRAEQVGVVVVVVVRGRGVFLWGGGWV